MATKDGTGECRIIGTRQNYIRKQSIERISRRQQRNVRNKYISGRQEGGFVSDALTSDFAFIFRPPFLSTNRYTRLENIEVKLRASNTFDGTFFILRDILYNPDEDSFSPDVNDYIPTQQQQVPNKDRHYLYADKFNDIVAVDQAFTVKNAENEDVRYNILFGVKVNAGEIEIGVDFTYKYISGDNTYLISMLIQDVIEQAFGIERMQYDYPGESKISKQT